MALVKVTIDGIEIEVEEGTTILNAARKIGGPIVPPAMCYYSSIKGSGGKCRTCLVRVAAGSTKDPRPMPKLVASCSTMVMDGMIVENTSNPEVLNARKSIVEMLLINHPLDCPVCDQAGECSLQDLSYEHGLAKTRYEFKRRTFDSTDIGEHVILHMNRCILCYRCVYTADQVTEGRCHGVIGRGDHAEISTYLEKSIDNDFSGNVIDVCPVGALTDRTFRFKSRVWFTKPMNVHRKCENEKCCGKAVAWMSENTILRITARKDENNEVKEFICNTCRFEKKEVNDWVIEGPRAIERSSVISQNHYTLEPKHTFKALQNSSKQ